jgi:cell division protein FtsW (lipid II flippase)
VARRKEDSVSAANPFGTLLALAGFLLEPGDVRSIVLPTIADALYERNLGKKQPHWLWRTRQRLLVTIGAALWEAAGCRLSGAKWGSLTMLGAAGLCGAAELSGNAPTRHLGAPHTIYLALGMVLATMIVASPIRLLRWLRSVTWLLAVAGIGLCPFLGQAFDGERQWLVLGPLSIHVATLFLPAYVVFVERAVAHRRWGWLLAIAGTVLGLLAAQPNWEAVTLYLAVAAISVLRRYERALTWLLPTLVLLATVLVARSAHLEASFRLAGLVMLLLVLAKNAIQLVRKPMAQLTTATMILFVLLRAPHGDTLPVVGFGGSALVAFSMLVALRMRAQSEASSTPALSS